MFDTQVHGENHYMIGFNKYNSIYWVEDISLKIKQINGQIIPKSFTLDQLLERLIFLKRCQDNKDIHKAYLFIKNNLNDKDKIEFEDGSTGLISWGLSEASVIVYQPIKKNGDISKSKRFLYANKHYKVKTNELLNNKA